MTLNPINRFIKRSAKKRLFFTQVYEMQNNQLFSCNNIDLIMDVPKIPDEKKVKRTSVQTFQNLIQLVQTSNIKFFLFPNILL